MRTLFCQSLGSNKDRMATLEVGKRLDRAPPAPSESAATSAHWWTRPFMETAPSADDSSSFERPPNVHYGSGVASAIVCSIRAWHSLASGVPKQAKVVIFHGSACAAEDGRHTSQQTCSKQRLMSTSHLCIWIETPRFNWGTTLQNKKTFNRAVLRSPSDTKVK